MGVIVADAVMVADADCGANLYCVKAMCIETLGTCAQDIPVP